MPHDAQYPLATAALRLVRRIFPARTRARTRRLMFDWLDLSWKLPSGVELRVAHYDDWKIYNEIFVSGEYDRALSIALDSVPDKNAPIHIVDLGANDGYFTLRAVDRIRQRSVADDGFTITAVEGNASFAKEFEARVEQNGLAPRVRLVHGLVGERAGDAVLYDNSLFTTKGTRGVRVPYVDLSDLLDALPHIDLLKCDIEGAELRFLQNYPDVLRKVRVAVFELHRNLCEVEQCKSLLCEYGFSKHAVFRAGDPCFLYGVWH